MVVHSITGNHSVLLSRVTSGYDGGELDGVELDGGEPGPLKIGGLTTLYFQTTHSTGPTPETTTSGLSDYVHSDTA